MPEILTDAYLLFTFVFKQALNINAKPAGLKESGRLPFKAREKNENYASVYSSRWKRGVNISSATRSG